MDMALPENQRFPGVFIHESVYVDDPVSIGEGTKIGPFSHIHGEVTIGSGCAFGQNVMVAPDVRIGDRCNIQNNVSIYKGIDLEDGVFCGPSAVFTNVDNPRLEIQQRAESPRTLVKQGATIGANATIVCGHTLGAYCFIGAGAVVTDDVLPHALMVGVPARRMGWISEAGGRLRADLICPIDGSRYRRRMAGGLERIA